jgi:hypothetical protein
MGMGEDGGGLLHALEDLPELGQPELPRLGIGVFDLRPHLERDGASHLGIGVLEVGEEREDRVLLTAEARQRRVEGLALLALGGGRALLQLGDGVLADGRDRVDGAGPHLGVLAPKEREQGGQRRLAADADERLERGPLEGRAAGVEHRHQAVDDLAALGADLFEHHGCRHALLGRG